MPPSHHSTKNARWPSWYAAIIALVTLAILIFQNLDPIRSTDLWWHMALGRYHIEHLTLTIDHSLFSWTPSKATATYNAWISGVILYLTYDLGGITALGVLRYSIIGLIILLGWRHAKSMQVHTHPLAWLTILIALNFLWPVNAIKPTLMTFGFMTISVWLYYHIRLRGDDAWPLCYVFPLTIVAWVNAHGGFFYHIAFFRCGDRRRIY